MTMNCQKCRTPLKLDPSLQDLNPAAFDLLVGPAPPPHRISIPSRPPYPKERDEKLKEAQKNARPPLIKRSLLTPSSRTPPKDNPAMSFVMLTESQFHSPPPIAKVSTNGTTAPVPAPPPTKSSSDQKDSSLSTQIESSTRLFEILSSRSDIDYPICRECADILVSSLSAKLSASQKERDAYISFLKELKSSIPSPASISQKESELAAAKAEQSKAFAELLELEKEKATLASEIASLEAESRALDLEEESFWRSRNTFALELASFTETRDALNAAYDYDFAQLQRLQRTNIYNDTFCIGHDGNFGTINGLRLGRLAPPNNTEWSEINAAWGTTAFLLATVAEKLGFTFRGYKIRPMGSTSYIEKFDTSHSPLGPASPPKPTILELYSSGDLPVGRTIIHRRFNDAMVAFLECIRQLGRWVEASERGRGLKLPYTIDKDKIHGVSIKLGVSQDTEWTSACKYTLTCCKFLLAHASGVAGAGRVSGRGGGGGS